MSAKWVCQECYDKLDKEYEIFTDYNWLQLKCFYCNERVAEHHVVNAPDVLPAHDTKSQLQNDPKNT